MALAALLLMSRHQTVGFLSLCKPAHACRSAWLDKGLDPQRDGKMQKKRLA
jgi:hypothetical protein